MFSHKKGKRGQLEITFNWIYIVIAGAVILLFFLGIVFKQKEISEERLSQEVVQVMGSILTGAGVSEKTKNVIDASGLADYVLYFSCDLGVGEFGIQGRPARIQNNIDPLFSPKEIQSTRLITWSLPYNLPFKVIDFLFVIPFNVKYYLVGNDADFIHEFLNSTEGIQRDFVLDLNNIEIEENLQIRLVDTDGSSVPSKGIPPQLQILDDKEVSAVVFTGQNNVDFYQKQGAVWRKLNQGMVRVISLGGERDAAKYAAIFAADDQLYQCNMGKAFKRLELLAEVYGGTEIAFAEAGGKLGSLIEHYKNDASNECQGYLEEYPQNALETLASLKNNAAACKFQEACLEVMTSAQQLQEVNTALRVHCTPLY